MGTPIDHLITCYLHRWRHRLPALLLIPLISACTPLLIQDEDQPGYRPLLDATLVLHQDVLIPVGKSRVFFQSGHADIGVNEFQPHCQLTVTQVSEAPQTIHADSFEIDRVTTGIDYVVEAAPVRLASQGEIQLASGSGEGTRSQVYRMRLHSERQPHVRHFICGGAFEFPAWARRPSLQDIHRAMGNYGTLELP